MRIIVFGAHPDDCEYRFGGTTAKCTDLGHAVKYVSVTGGDAGHHEQGGAVLVARRRAEAIEGARRLGVAACEVLNHHDGEYLPTPEKRMEIIRLIRDWQADVVLSHRPNDYHPDHRYVGTVVQDAAYLVTVPNLCPSTPALKHNPIFLYLEDPFRKPAPFTPDIVVDIDDTWDRKVEALDAHVSQFYEWLPWLDGTLGGVPADPTERKEWLSRRLESELKNDFREALERRYGKQRAGRIRHAEAFEVCEYGRQPSPEELASRFPL